MRELNSYSRLRRALLLCVPTALVTRSVTAQNQIPLSNNDDEDVRLPSGKKQKDEIAKADYEQNLKDALELLQTAKAFEEDLEKDDRYVISIGQLKKLDDIDRLTKRIRARMKRL